MNSKSINVNQTVKRIRSGGGRPFHSRLEPFTGFIREQRQGRFETPASIVGVTRKVW
jgi:hypothetical protein